MKTFAEILNGIEETLEKKVESKIPSWKGLKIPSSLNFEQCSSEATAEYKASLVKNLGVRTLADLTGGLGVDSAAFSKALESVLYVERDGILAGAAVSNFAALGITNIEIRNAETDVSLVDDLQFFDCIYLDPARRSAAGKKVFLLEDCCPDVTVLLPHLLNKAEYVLLKLSPMADITMLKHKLGPSLRQIHIVGAEGECKELLCLLQGRGDATVKDIVAVNSVDLVVADTSKSGLSIKVDPGITGATFYEGIPLAGAVLCEPAAIVQKAGCQNFFCKTFSLSSLSSQTGLCILEKGASLPDSSFYKSFEILYVFPFNKQSCKVVAAKYPSADVTARGLSMRSEDLASRLKVRSGGGVHIFGTVCGKEKCLIVARRIDNNHIFEQ